jgi:hypothetical protein
MLVDICGRFLTCWVAVREATRGKVDVDKKTLRDRGQVGVF